MILSAVADCKSPGAGMHDDTTASIMNLQAAVATVLALLRGTLLCCVVGAVSQSMAEEPLPEHLAATGLFLPGSTTEVRSAVLAFSPQYPLWSDGAAKRRWIALPPDTFVDARRQTAWEFPVGTRLWKEFSLDRRVETRFMERLTDGSWRYATYVWNEDQSDALLAPAKGISALPVTVAPGGRYAIPSEADCRACHEGPAVPVLGFSALQLSGDRDPLAVHVTASDRNDLRELAARGVLRNLPAALIERPPRIAAASPTERAALGYLHGNCGHCHNAPEDSDASVPVSMRLAQDVGDPASSEKVLRSLIGVSARFRLRSGQVSLPLIAAGDSRASMLAVRMRSRDARAQMPPLGTAIPDSEGLALIERWIDHELTETQEKRP
jgi:hypothetical protein